MPEYEINQLIRRIEFVQYSASMSNDFRVNCGIRLIVFISLKKRKKMVIEKNRSNAYDDMHTMYSY